MNKNMKKTIIAIAILLMILPAVGNAMTREEILVKINEIILQIQRIQEQIKVIQASLQIQEPKIEPIQLQSTSTEKKVEDKPSCFARGGCRPKYIIES